MVPDIVALYGFSLSMAMWIKSSEMLLKVHLGGEYQKFSSGDGRSRFTVGKKVEYSSRLSSLLVCATIVVHLVAGFITCRNGILALVASVDSEEMKLAACHMLDSSRPSSQLTQ